MINSSPSPSPDLNIAVLAKYLKPYLEANPEATVDPLLDPVRWVHVRLGHKTAPYQDDIIRAPFLHRRTAIRASQSLGKSYAVADAALAYFNAFDDAIVISTAPTFRQVAVILWGYIRNAHQQNKLSGELFRMEVRVNDLHYMLGFSTVIPENFQGIHSPHILVIVDEASGINPILEEAIEGMLTSNDAVLMLVGNPTKLTGMFYDAFHNQKSLYHTIHLSSFDSPNFYLDGRYNSSLPPDARPDPNAWYRALATPEWVEERKAIWGEDNPFYQVRVLGEFPAQDEFGLIPIAQLEAAIACECPTKAGPTATGRRATADSSGPLQGFVDNSIKEFAHAPLQYQEVAVGIDIAGSGSNKSVMYLRYDYHIVNKWSWVHKTTMQSVAMIQEFLSGPEYGLLTTDAQGTATHRIDAIQIDANGIGRGVYDRLNELGWPVKDFNSANKPSSDDYHDKRAEAFWNTRKLFETGSICNLFDEDTRTELAILKWELPSSNKIRIISKKKMALPSRESPDNADAFAMCCYPTKGRYGSATVVEKLRAMQAELEISPPLLGALAASSAKAPRIAVVAMPTYNRSNGGSRWRR